ncbi:MAG: hypothetical protein O2954_09185 [bacterium]|nr:hypothetical protein [bacterium]
MIRIFSILFLLAAMLLPHCLCWMPAAEAMACHAVQEKPACCCSEQPEVRQADADVSPLLPAADVRLPAPGMYAGLQPLFFTFPLYAAIRREIAQDLSVSRASPSLYLIHTSFLI